MWVVAKGSTEHAAVAQVVTQTSDTTSKRGSRGVESQGGGPDHQRPWNPFRPLWRRRLEGRLQPHPTTDPPLLRAIHGPGAGCRRRKRLGNWSGRRVDSVFGASKGSHLTHRPTVHNKLGGSPQDFQSVGLSRCHNNEIEIQGPVIAMKSTEMRHSRMWLALQFREPEDPPPSSFQAATVQSKRY